MARRSRALPDWDAFEREQLEAEARVKAKQQAYRQRADVKAKRQAQREEDKRLIALARRLGLDASGDIQKVG